MIRLKRAYEAAAESDGHRILVERLWPRGLTKEAAAIDHWAKGVSPSPDLRKWYAHDIEKWDSFSERYVAELDANEMHVGELIETIQQHETVTFVYAAKDEAHNSAIVLRDYLKQRGCAN